jgi:putative hydrolase of the HAD superfamily
MSSIEFIYFDLGNVILEFDHSIAFRAVSDLTGLPAKQVDQALFDSGLQQRYETGLIDCTQFHQQFCELTETEPPIESFLNAISNIFTVNGSIVPVLTQLKARGFPLGILSNTCDAHWQFVFNRHAILKSFFHPYVLSYEAKSMKPDSKIYETAIEKSGVHPERIFFTDDRQENIDGAIAAGIDARLFTNAQELVSQLKQRGVLINF